MISLQYMHHTGWHLYGSALTQEALAVQTQIFESKRHKIMNKHTTWDPWESVSAFQMFMQPLAVTVSFFVKSPDLTRAQARGNEPFTTITFSSKMRILCREFINEVKCVLFQGWWWQAIWNWHGNVVFLYFILHLSITNKKCLPWKALA